MPTTPDTYLDLFFAYTAVWVLISVFVVRLMRGQSRLAAELKTLQRELDAGQSS